MPLQPFYNITILSDKDFAIYIICDNNRKTQYYIFNNIQNFSNNLNNIAI